MFAPTSVEREMITSAQSKILKTLYANKTSKNIIILQIST